MECLMSFGIQGPKGDTGARGPQGPQGPTGPSSAGMGLLSATRTAKNSGDGSTLPKTLYNGPAMRLLVVLSHSSVGGDIFIYTKFPPESWYIRGVAVTATSIIQTEWISSGSFTFLIFG